MTLGAPTFSGLNSMEMGYVAHGKDVSLGTEGPYTVKSAAGKLVVALYDTTCSLVALWFPGRALNGLLAI